MCIQAWHEEQSDDGFGAQAADGSDGHGLEHVRALVEVQGQGRKTDHRGDRGHTSAVQANLRSPENGFAAGQALWLVELLGEGNIRGREPGKRSP